MMNIAFITCFVGVLGMCAGASLAEGKLWSGEKVPLAEDGAVVLDDNEYLLNLADYEKLEQGGGLLVRYVAGKKGLREDSGAFYFENSHGKMVSAAVEPVSGNAGKTECLNYILRKVKNTGKRFALTSIGIDRPLKKDRDYQRSLGSPITVKLYAPLKGKKEYTGELLSYTPDSFTISVKGEEMTFQKKDASKVQPYIDFKALEKDLDELEADFENIETEEEN